MPARSFRDRGIPHSATCLIDTGGGVRWKGIETGYKIRPTNAAIPIAVRTLPHGK